MSSPLFRRMVEAAYSAGARRQLPSEWAAEWPHALAEYFERRREARQPQPATAPSAVATESERATLTAETTKHPRVVERESADDPRARREEVDCVEIEPGYYVPAK